MVFFTLKSKKVHFRYYRTIIHYIGIGKNAQEDNNYIGILIYILIFTAVDVIILSHQVLGVWK